MFKNIGLNGIKVQTNEFEWILNKDIDEVQGRHQIFLFIYLHPCVPRNILTFLSEILDFPISTAM